MIRGLAEGGPNLREERPPLLLSELGGQQELLQQLYVQQGLQQQQLLATPAVAATEAFDASPRAAVAAAVEAPAAASAASGMKTVGPDTVGPPTIRNLLLFEPQAKPLLLLQQHLLQLLQHKIAPEPP